MSRAKYSKKLKTQLEAGTWFCKLNCADHNAHYTARASVAKKRGLSIKHLGSTASLSSEKQVVSLSSKLP